jgi:hypothetical protein
MTLAARRARRAADAREPGSIINAADVTRAIESERTEERIVKLAAAAKPKRRGRFTIMEGKAA